jgi:HTH-type transcriptional regulator/antitoxin HigA
MLNTAEAPGRKIVEREEFEMRVAAMNRVSAARKLNPQRYARLLSRQLPTVIRTEEENEEMLAAIWELMKKGEDKLSAEELALLELMSVLVERFEEEHYQIPDSPPHRILQHLMESRNARQADLVPILGGRGRVSELVNGKRAISKAQAKALADFFHVSAELFL